MAAASPTFKWMVPDEFKEFPGLHTGESHECTALVFWGPHLVVSGHTNGAIVVRDIENRGDNVLVGHTYSISALVVWRTLLASSSDKDIFVYEKADRTPWTKNARRILRGHTSVVFCLATFRDELASGSGDKTVRLWNYETGRNTRTFYGFSSWVYSIVEHNEFLICGDLSNTIIWIKDGVKPIEITKFYYVPHPIVSWNGSLMVNQDKGGVRSYNLIDFMDDDNYSLLTEKFHDHMSLCPTRNMNRNVISSLVVHKFWLVGLEIWCGVARIIFWEREFGEDHKTNIVRFFELPGHYTKGALAVHGEHLVIALGTDLYIFEDFDMER